MALLGLGRKKVERAVGKLLSEIRTNATAGLEVCTVSLKNTDIPLAYTLETVLPTVVNAVQRAGFSVLETHCSPGSYVATITVRTSSAATEATMATPTATSASSASAVGRLPSDALNRLERYGRHEFDREGSTERPEEMWPLVSVFMGIARANPAVFLAQMASAVLPAGGYAALGAASVIYDVVPSDNRRGTSYEAIMTTACRFLRDSGVPRSHADNYLLVHWSKVTDETW
jgi:hypothetical protein